jgi:hypothetical protein
MYGTMPYLGELEAERDRITGQMLALDADVASIKSQIEHAQARRFAFDARFIDVARRVLPKEQYVAILSQASA